MYTDRAMWDTILPYLSTLWIVAQQPLNHNKYVKESVDEDPKPFEERMDEWAKGLTPIKDDEHRCYGCYQ